jgi:uncharacterized cupin superfamily protein
VSTKDENISIAPMVAPPEWSEPHQNPEFDEWTLICSGRKHIEVDGQSLVLEAGQSTVIKKGARVATAILLKNHVITGASVFLHFLWMPVHCEE